ncbi:MAG TPA: ATP-grasp domain-containing protein [Streptosporangiaceae bacterium]|nr:ATP-grasp domain-containing protein [Streptosporangiaceae bacterium]
MTRVPVVLIDHNGYDMYHDRGGRSFIPADRYAVRLVTDIAHLDQAHGPELTSVVGVPKTDYRALADAATFQYSFGGQTAERVIAVTERLLIPAAELRSKLGLAGPTVPETTLFRDKIAMKQHLRGHGITVPDFAQFSLEAVRELFRTHQVLIAKPRMGAGAENVFVLRSPSDAARFRTAHSASLDEFEIEEFVQGPLFHVDSVVQSGQVIAAAAGRYLDDATSYRQLAPCRSISVGDGPLLDTLLDFNCHVISCYPGFTGVTHHEVFITQEGPCFCEIAARAGGGGVAACFHSRTGINLHEVGIQAQLLDAVPSTIDISRHFTGWVAIYADPGVLREPIEPLAEPWVIESKILAKPGAQLSSPGRCADAVAIISVTGDTEAEVISRLDTVVRTTVPVMSAG